MIVLIVYQIDMQKAFTYFTREMFNHVSPVKKNVTPVTVTRVTEY